MRSKTFIIIFISTFLLLLNSCVTYYYPQAVDVPLIKEKGDFRLDVGGFIIPKINPTNESDSSVLADMGIHSTFSAGITDLLATQTFVSLDVLLRVHLHGALGLYKAFDNNTVMELYCGFGYGNGFLSGMHSEGKDDYLLSFAQFNIGHSGSGKSNTDFGLGLKGGYLHTNSVNGDFYKKNGWVFDPSIFIRFGGNKAKYNIKLIYMWTDTVAEQYYFPLSMSMGVNLDLGKKSKNK